MHQAAFLDESGCDWSTGLAPPEPAPPGPSPLGWLAETDFGGIEPHDYQAKAFARIFEEFQSGKKSTLVVMPTGTGKSALFGFAARYVIEELGGRVLIRAHRGTLLEQAAQELQSLGVRCAIEQAEQRAMRAIRDSESSFEGPIRCVIGSVQTLHRKRLEEDWPRDYFKLLVTDEAHHAVAGGYDGAEGHFEDCWHLGVTATPNRKDRKNLGKKFASVAHEYTLYEAVRDKYLCELTLKKANVRVDIRNLRTDGDDLNKGDLEDAVNLVLQQMVPEVKRLIGDRRTMVFTPHRRSAAAYAEALREVGISAKDVHGETPDKKAILRDFAAGEFQVLCSCDLLTEGYNNKPVSAIVLARATKSDSLLMQMIGRGTRNYKDSNYTKHDCLLIDFDWQVKAGVLANPVKLIAPKLASKEQIAIATAAVASGDQESLFNAIEEADGEAKERAKQAREKARLEAEEKKRLRLNIRDRESNMEWRTINPLDFRGGGSDRDPVFDIGVRVPGRGSSAPASDAAVELLCKAGYERHAATTMSAQMAGIAIAEVKRRWRLGLATYKQVKTLKKYHVPGALTMTKAEASAWIGSRFGDRNRSA